MVLDRPSSTSDILIVGPPVAYLTPFESVTPMLGPRQNIPRHLPASLVLPQLGLLSYPGKVINDVVGRNSGAPPAPTFALQLSWNGSTRGLQEPSLHWGPCEPK